MDSSIAGDLYGISYTWILQSSGLGEWPVLNTISQILSKFPGVILPLSGKIPSRSEVSKAMVSGK